GTHHPNRSVLIGEASDEPQAYWLGQAYPPNGPITFNLRDIPLAVVRATVSQAKTTDGQLVIKAKQYRTTEVPNPGSITSSVLTVTIDGNPVAYVLSDNQSTWNQAVQLTSWPKRLECVVTPGADGSLGDGFAIDLGIQLKDMKEPLWLRTVAPSYSKFNYKSAKLLLMTEAWQLPGAGLARWDNLEAELNARQAGIKALEAARPKIAAAKDKKTIDEAVSEVLKADPKQTEIRLVAAARFRELGDLAQERRQWGLLAEDSRADLSLIQQARLRIDAIWAEMDPEPFVYPDDHSPMRNVRALGRQWKGIGEFTNNIWTLVIDKEKSWADKLAFNAPDADKFAVMVNSLGIEVTARLTAGEKVVAERTSKQPLLIVDASEAGIKAGTPLELTVSIDPDITGILLTHTMEVAAWPVKSDADLPTEAWDVAVHKDGTATVSRTSKAPVLAAIPRTAMNLMIEGAAAYTIQEPITEYLVQWDGKLGGANIPLFAVPEPGKEMRITYHWPDAAYNVPMSKYSWDRHDHVYMSTPACLLDTDKKSVWRITEMPADWKVEEFTPKPVNDAAKPLVFNVEPAGGLSARWEAHDVLTSWICMNHGNIRFYVPDNPNNRRFFPVWMKYVRVIHDKQLKVSGHNRPYMLYIGPTGASMLSGYGGGTAGDDLSSETWIASTGRMAPCVWRHGDNVTGVDSHELHWVTLRCRVPGSPTWTDQGYGCWLEQIGWEATELANSEWWRRQRMKAITPALELIKASGKNPIQSEGPAWDALPGNDRELMIHLGWFICDEIYRTYGEGFWPKFWAAQWDLYADVYPILSDRAKQILFVDELVRISGDPKLRERFEKEWLFDLTPDPQDAPDRFLILPRDPRITTEDNLEFAKLDCDDRCWAASSGLGPWQEKVVGMKGYNGVAWYRFTFDVPKDFKDENLELVLGRINNCDECYLNGTKIGASGKFPPDWEDASRVDRVYKVPKGLLKPGQQNVLAVRVFGNIGSGAIYERPRLISRISD
ncbi:MAG TPA: beta galactosidase jelly roll domain-containing protein, partial [Armatimonadota bacterium]|nr:beta galactosidase jelly roll domain-containing protein [Armatimonadota bacterium]